MAVHDIGCVMAQRQEVISRSFEIDGHGGPIYPLQGTNGNRAIGKAKRIANAQMLHSYPFRSQGPCPQDGMIVGDPKVAVDHVVVPAQVSPHDICYRSDVDPACFDIEAANNIPDLETFDMAS